DFFYEEYGVRKPDNYDELKNGVDDRENKESGGDTPEDNNGNNTHTPKVSGREKDVNPDNSDTEKRKQLSWFRRLLRLFFQAPTAHNQQLVGAFGSHRTNNVQLAKFVAAKAFDKIKEDMIKNA